MTPKHPVLMAVDFMLFILSLIFAKLNHALAFYDAHNTYEFIKVMIATLSPAVVAFFSYVVNRKAIHQYFREQRSKFRKLFKKKRP